MPTVLQELRRTTAEHDGVILEMDGGWIVLDRLARRFLPISNDKASARTTSLLESVSSFLSEANRAALSLQASHTVHVQFGNDGRLPDASAVEKVLRSIGGSASLRVFVYFDSPPSRWDEPIEWLVRLRRWQPAPNRLTISLIGPFEPLDDDAKTALFEARVFLQVVHGWWLGSGPDDHTAVRDAAMRDLCQFSLAETHRATYAWSVNDHCRGCCWRYICGGADPLGGPLDALRTASHVHLVRETHKLFLEVFTRQRCIV